MPDFKANTSSAGTSRSSHQQQQQTTPSPPLASTAEQSPQLLGADGAGPCTSSSAASSSQGTSRPPPPLAMSGIRAAQSLAEWQLQAVLFRARLSQYFDVFISQGGDDIDQLIQCDEPEFLEIMSLVGMASKPLHVRRLQRTLNEFSNNKAQFLVGVVPFIGLPPFHYPGSLSTGEILTAVLKVLVPESKMPLDMSYLPQQQQQPVHGDFLFPLSQQNALPPPAFLGPKPESSFSFLDQQLLLSLLNAPSPAPGIFPTTSAASGSIKRARMSSSPPSTPVDRQSSAAFSSPRHSSPASDRLTEPEILRLVQLAHELVAQLPAKLEPRTGQGKRRVERGLLEAISLPVEDPLRAEHFRLFARIYGRFDAKRRPDKPLTRKERIVNEAATQLSLLRPDLLARRDELFPLARKLARMFELPAGMMEPGSPERSCSGASSAAESAVEMPSRERAREEAEGGDEEEAEGEEEEANVAAE